MSKSRTGIDRKNRGPEVQRNERNQRTKGSERGFLNGKPGDCAVQVIAKTLYRQPNRGTCTHEKLAK